MNGRQGAVLLDGREEELGRAGGGGSRRNRLPCGERGYQRLSSAAFFSFFTAFSFFTFFGA